MVMAGAPLCRGFEAALLEAGFFAAGLAAAGFFFPAFFTEDVFPGAGMFMPGMCIGWDIAGAATIAALSRKRESVTRTPLSRDEHPRWPAGGATGLAVAVLAGARVAAAARFGGASALAVVRGGGLAIGHFSSPFCVAPIERIAI